jgi:hypothetical protein
MSSKKERPKQPAAARDDDLQPPDEDIEEEDEELDEDDDLPRVILGRVGDLARWMPEGYGKKFGDRPVWFLIQDDAELVGLFERIPEDPMPKGQSQAILGGLRAFAAERAEALQRVLGPTDALGYGFHVDATLARVRASFEQDGFELAGEIKGGEVVAHEVPDEP